MSAPKNAASVKPSPSPSTTAKPQSIQVCNFRSAARLSNENARALTTINEALARNLASTLTTYVGIGLRVRSLDFDQVPVRDYVASIPEFTYVASFHLNATSSNLILQCNNDLIFPIIDLLLGGTGIPMTKPRELSEIEEDITQGLMSQIGYQAAIACDESDSTDSIAKRIEPAKLEGLFSTNEKILLMRFELEMAGISGMLQLIVPATLANTLIKKHGMSHSQRKGPLRFFPTRSIRERILDCDVVVAADLPNVRVSVRDLVGLQPGSVLKLRVPVRTPGMLTVQGLELFEAIPVRNGAQKATQVGRRVQPTSWGKE